MVHGIRGACVLCNVQQYGWTLYLKTTPSIHRIVIVRGAISSKTKVMFRTRMCKQSLLIVSSCYIRVQAMIITKECSNGGWGNGFGVEGGRKGARRRTMRGNVVLGMPIDGC